MWTRQHGIDNTFGRAFVLRLCFNRSFITYQHRLHVSEVSRCFHCSSNHEAQSATQTEDGIPVLRTDCGDGVHREEFSHTRAFAIVLVLGLNACFVIFWSRLLFLVFLSDGTH